MLFVKASEATASRRRVYFDLRDATDGITPETGEGGASPELSVDGGAWTSTGIGTLTHIGNGRYYADLTTGIVGSTGSIIQTRYKSAETVETPGDTVMVIGPDLADAVRMGVTSLPNAAAGEIGGLPVLDSNLVVSADIDPEKLRWTVSTA